MSKRIPEAILAVFLATVPVSAFAAPVTVADGWFRALPANLPSGGYFTLHNGGPAQIVLTGASSSACGMLMLHLSETMNGMASMSGVTSIPVAPGATLKFAPGGYHLMCMNPTPAMKQGASVPVTLEFAGGATMTAPFAVKNAKGE